MQEIFCQHNPCSGLWLGHSKAIWLYVCRTGRYILLSSTFSSLFEDLAHPPTIQHCPAFLLLLKKMILSIWCSHRHVSFFIASHLNFLTLFDLAMFFVFHRIARFTVSELHSSTLYELGDLWRQLVGLELFKAITEDCWSPHFKKFNS